MRSKFSFVPWITGSVALIVYLICLPLAVVERPRHEQLFALPPKLLRIVAFQFKEAAADMSFLNASVFLGGTTPQHDTRRYLPQQYSWMYNTLKNSVALDPYFLDPYYLMNSALIWDRYKQDEVNELIAKGADKRTWDSLLPFYAGFNYYYFLNNADKSFTYLTEASKRSGGNPFYDSLAARVAYKANKTEFAISYLENQIQQADLHGQRGKTRDLERRLEVLKAIRRIEIAAESYRKLFGKPPGTVSELIKSSLLLSLPSDPYGGSFYIDQDGSIKTTSNMTSVKKEK
ncbi:MAG TPA: hypothetical protein VIH45_04810 [Desulfuromonadaceae bacterium]